MLLAHSQAEDLSSKDPVIMGAQMRFVEGVLRSMRELACWPDGRNSRQYVRASPPSPQGP